MRAVFFILLVCIAFPFFVSTVFMLIGLFQIFALGY